MLLSWTMTPEEQLKKAQADLAAAKVRVRYQAELKKRNAKFRAMTKGQQRVEIAKDVLKQLELKRYVAGSTFLRIENHSAYDYDSRRQLQEVRDDITCEVCGIGSLMVSACAFANKLTVGQADEANAKGIHKYLGTWFSSEQLNLIERWFESDRDDNGAVRDVLLSIPRPPQGHPIMKKRLAHGRLRAIMENIVSNKGTFDPTCGKHGQKPKDE